MCRDWLGDDVPPDELNHALRDGSLLVADDCAGAIYRITYRKP